MSDNLIFEKSRRGRRAFLPTGCAVDKRRLRKLLSEVHLRKTKLSLPELSEPDVVRHFTRLSQENMGVDSHFYPLGSCTMKYNPKVNESLAHLPGFAGLHPYQSQDTVQGVLHLLHQMAGLLEEISGMSKVSLQPSAGAHGELTSLMMMKAFYEERNEVRDEVLVPDSAHGTNPASSRLAGLRVVAVDSNETGEMDLKDLSRKMNHRVISVMMTVPNTLGLFERGIIEVSEIVHSQGGFLYLDGANLNALLGITKPADFGVDIMHFNLHKTFAAPHGGGGPGSGPVGAKDELAPYLPTPLVERNENGYYLDSNRGRSIGRVRSFYGNIEVILKAYCYLRILGREGLREVSENAILNANYLKAKLKSYYHVPFDKTCMHEFVLSAKDKKANRVGALDIAKRLLDFGIHPPTVYFPLIVEEALMIEPTETESKETLDSFISAMIQISQEIENEPSLVREAPHKMRGARLDEVKAAREPRLNFSDEMD